MNGGSGRVNRPHGLMIDPDDPIAPHRLAAVERTAIESLGVFFDPKVVALIAACITDKVHQGVVDQGILYQELVSDAGVPSWVAFRGLLGPVLALVSVESYRTDGVILRALTRPSRDQAPPSQDFCDLLEQLGLVKSQSDREACLEMWDYHWKLAVSRLETRGRAI